jgi:hypothetical protein
MMIEVQTIINSLAQHVLCSSRRLFGAAGPRVGRIDGSPSTSGLRFKIKVKV